MSGTVSQAGATSAFAAGVQALTEALRAAAADPLDQIRLLMPLAAFSPSAAAGSDAIGQAQATVQTATAALCRRAALTSLARACAAYQPSSFNDAQSLIITVADLYDAEIVLAADAGDDASYLALRALQAAVIRDLVTRGSLLPQLTTITTAVPLPSLTLAYRLYQDATRSDDLIARADPIHPAFMPTSFQALSS